MTIHDTVRERLAAELDARGMNAKEVSDKAGLGATAVSDILNGKSRRPGLDTVAAIAQALELTLDNLTGLEPRTLSVVMPMQVAYLGHVLAGNTAKSSFWPEPEPVIFLMPASNKYPGVPRFFFSVEGDGMNQVIAHGELAICATYQDLKTEPKHGDYVLCRETREDGSRKLSFHQLLLEGDQRYLVNCSTRPILAATVEVTDKVELYARVVGFQREFD